jgi:glycosyltransferase involved in cell wall biosynthesis
MQKFTIHLVSLPHTQTTKDYSHCAYTEKVRKFANMMKKLGHTVYLYASQDNQAECDELITCITKKQQKDLLGISKPTDNLGFEFTISGKGWKEMNGKAIKEIASRIKEGDFICLIGGACQKDIADAFPNNISIEYGIGYEGVFSNFMVFESYAWLHAVYGGLYGASRADGRYFDAVIPNYYETNDFPLTTQKGDYFLFIGRLIDRKGWQIAQQVCEKLGKRLIIAGQGEFSGYGEYVGVVGPKKRAKLMGEALGVFVPTRYLEPFGGVHAEAMLCGTPVITPDFGVFTETVENGFNGFRCKSFGDFCEAARRCERFEESDYKAIRGHAQSKWSSDVVMFQYQEYLDRLSTLKEKGWYSEKSWL